MMLHAPVMALLLTAWLGAATLLWAAAFATTLLRHWNLASGARRQIELERRTHLVATLLTLVMLAQAVALPLMVFNADRTAPLLVGAMCAFGSFNASVYGFPALYAKLALFFAAVVWLALHHADLRAPDYPLTAPQVHPAVGAAAAGAGRRRPDHGLLCRPEGRHTHILLRQCFQSRTRRRGR
jgi:hypothetical protein